MVIYLYCEVLSYCNLLGECKNKINNNYYAILKVLYKHPTSKYNNFNVSTYTPTIAKCKVAPILKAVVQSRNLVSQLTEQMLNRLSLTATKEQEVDIDGTRKHFEINKAQAKVVLQQDFFLVAKYKFAPSRSKLQPWFCNPNKPYR